MPRTIFVMWGWNYLCKSNMLFWQSVLVFRNWMLGRKLFPAIGQLLCIFNTFRELGFSEIYGRPPTIMGHVTIPSRQSPVIENLLPNLSRRNYAWVRQQRLLPEQQEWGPSPKLSLIQWMVAAVEQGIPWKNMMLHWFIKMVLWPAQRHVIDVDYRVLVCGWIPPKCKVTLAWLLKIDHELTLIRILLLLMTCFG